MTALIIGLIAALGIGGGILIADNGGGGGGNSAIVETNPGAGKEDYEQKAALASMLDPNEAEFLSVLTDREQYTDVSFGGSSSLQNPTVGISANAEILSLARANNDANEIYVDIPEFNQEINDGSGTNKRRLSLTDKSGIIRLTTGKLLNPQSNAEEVYVVDFTNDMKTNGEYARRFTDKSDTDGIKQQNDLYLGGAANNTHLTVADFGFWTEYRDDKSVAGGNTGILTEYPIFLYDTRFLYAGGRSDTTTLNGNVLMIYEDKISRGSKPYDVYGGTTEISLDLAKNTVAGSFAMDAAAAAAFGKPENEFDCSFSGNLEGSNFIAGQNQIKDVNGNTLQSNGAKGQLLVGKHGLEMVGIVDRRWEDGNSAQYVFGAKE